MDGSLGSLMTRVATKCDPVAQRGKNTHPSKRFTPAELRAMIMFAAWSETSDQSQGYVVHGNRPLSAQCGRSGEWLAHHNDSGRGSIVRRYTPKSSSNS